MRRAKLGPSAPFLLDWGVVASNQRNQAHGVRGVRGGKRPGRRHGGNARQDRCETKASTTKK